MGPTENIWSDKQCPNLGSDWHGLDDCKKACLETPGCNAIHFVLGARCILRGCKQPVPDPVLHSSNYKGYYLLKGTYKE